MIYSPVAVVCVSESAGLARFGAYANCGATRRAMPGKEELVKPSIERETIWGTLLHKGKQATKHPMQQKQKRKSECLPAQVNVTHSIPSQSNPVHPNPIQSGIFTLFPNAFVVRAT